MSFEIHMVIANNRSQALARLSTLVAGRNHALLSTGFRSLVTFEDADDPRRSCGKDSRNGPLFCAVARVDAA